MMVERKDGGESETCKERRETVKSGEVDFSELKSLAEERPLLL